MKSPELLPCGPQTCMQGLAQDTPFADQGTQEQDAPFHMQVGGSLRLFQPSPAAVMSWAQKGTKTWAEAASPLPLPPQAGSGLPLAAPETCWASRPG